MRKELIDKAIKSINQFINRETDMLPSVAEEGFSPIKTNKENFHELAIFPNINTITAIDGGNGNILIAPNFSVDFVRIVAVSYFNNKKINTIIKEAILFIRANEDGFSVESFGDNIVRINELPNRIDTLDNEKYNLEITSVAGIIRRLAELNMASKIIEGAVLVDGSIKAKIGQELNLIKRLKDKQIGFLSKTSKILTKNASSLNFILNELGPKSSWYYNPVFEIKNPNYLGELSFVKLHDKSKYVFKLETMKGIHLKEFVELIKTNSNDSVFLGYPYPLIEADNLARVKNEEREYMKSILLSKLENNERLQFLLTSVDAHDILDNIRF